MQKRVIVGSVSLSLDNAAFNEMLHGWQAVGNAVPISMTQDLNLRFPAPETNAFPFD